MKIWSTSREVVITEQTSDGRVPGNTSATERADRILDATGMLVLRHGYGKVTIDDIAGRAGVGKGTVYLHWRTKRTLFEALLLRESTELIEELLGVIRQDPAEVRPHRFLRTQFLINARKPLLRALVTGDVQLLGEVTSSSPLTGRGKVAEDGFYDLMSKYGLLRADIPNLRYALNASVTGFYLIDDLDPRGAELDVRSKADAVANTVRAAFEPAAEPGRDVLLGAATEVTGIFRELLPPYRRRIYQYR